MINGKAVLGIIPARGGSKGVLRKNIRAVAGKPLIAWTIEAAKKSEYIDRLVLSSEDAEIIRVANVWGCEVPFVRPVELAQDGTPGIAPVLHALDNLRGYDYVVLLQPTSPLRTTSEIDGCLALCEARGAPACVSVTEPAHHPQWMHTVDANQHLKPLVEHSATRRQDLPTVYAVNGAVYVAQVSWLPDSRSFIGDGTLGYVMPPLHSLDIDVEEDLILAECLLQRRDVCQI
ncbi:MAG: acylneuraminate cytidylyltransferase family protein [Rhodocyclaceae bacterium]|nr:acylneuraminate cytidylyltransferase family protein [Rhodocyclaceae bacterium]